MSKDGYVYVYKIPQKENEKIEKGIKKTEKEVFALAKGRPVVIIKILNYNNRPTQLVYKGNVFFHPSNVFNDATPISLSVSAKMMPDKVDQSRLIPVYTFKNIDIDNRGDEETSFTNVCTPLIKESQNGTMKKIRHSSFGLMNIIHTVMDGDRTNLNSYEFHIDHWELMDALLHLEKSGTLPKNYQCAERYLTSAWKKMCEFDITVIFSPNFVRDQNKYVRNNHKSNEINK